MNQITPALVDRWHDFYLLSGTAAATLMGLLFVALSLNLDLILHDSRTHLRDVARQAFFGYLGALLISFLILIPFPNIRQLAPGLVVLGTMQMIHTGRRLMRVPGNTDPTFGKLYMLRRLVAPFLAAVGLIVSGIALFRNAGPLALLGIAEFVIIMLAGATNSAWDLLVRVAHLRVQDGAGKIH